MSNLIYWNFNIFAFSAVVAIHLTHHHSGMNTELTIAYNLLLANYLPYLEYDFMVANLVRLNLAVLKISEASQDHTRGGVLYH